MKAILEENNLLKPLKVGEIVEPIVVTKQKGAILLDLGPYGSGIIYGREFIEAKEILKDLKPGDKIFAKVIEPKNEEGYVELSAKQAGRELTWEELRQKKEKEETIKVKISGANKGGLLAEVSGINAFLPVSQLSSNNYPKVEGGDSAKILKELQKFVGKELEVQIFDLDPKSEKLILSEKLKELNKVKELLKNYKIGQVVEGEITGIVEFGAFVKFGKENLEGLIHISELDWKIIENPGEILKLGQKIKAKIISISDGKVFLSKKALEKDPWEGIDQNYKKGDVILGKVTKLNHFGAFVQITDQIQGLCHISEFGTESKMAEKLEKGKTYKFEILEVKPQDHKMNLKLVENNEKSG